MLTRKSLSVLGLIVLLLPFSLFANKPGNKEPAHKKTSHTYISHFENVLGTSMELKVGSASEDDATLAENAALSEIKRMSNILSAYDPKSEFSRWYQTNNQPIVVSKELFEVLSLFDQWRLKSNGALDASAEVIGKLWKQAAARQQVPTEEQLNLAVAEIKQVHWKLDPVTQTATHLSYAPVMLNSFVKTYIIRKAAEAAMNVPNIKSVVVNIGGDLVVLGNQSEIIDVKNPAADAENDLPMDRIQVGNRAIATSGNYRRGELINGKWYSHIVDPRTGLPADNIISATVVAPGATDAGALATAFNVMKPAESVQLAATIPGVDYLIITSSGERIESKGWRKLRIPSLKTIKQADRKSKISFDKESNFELVVNLEISTQPEQFVKRPYVAVWIEDQNHAAVRTIAVWHERDRYLPELKSWFLKYRSTYTTDKSVLSSVSSATRSPGKYTMKWDGKDDKGNIVPPGTYTVKIEISREHGTYQLLKKEMNFNDSPQSFTFDKNVEIASASLEYRKKTGSN